MLRNTGTDDDLLDSGFKALADHNRRNIIRMVHEQPGITLQEISGTFPISRFAVMNHINIVEGAGIIRSEKESIYRHFYPVTGAMERVFDTWLASLPDAPGETTSDAPEQKGEP